MSLLVKQIGMLYRPTRIGDIQNELRQREQQDPLVLENWLTRYCSWRLYPLAQPKRSAKKFQPTTVDKQVFDRALASIRFPFIDDPITRVNKVAGVESGHRFWDIHRMLETAEVANDEVKNVPQQRIQAIKGALRKHGFLNRAIERNLDGLLEKIAWRDENQMKPNAGSSTENVCWKM